MINISCVPASDDIGIGEALANHRDFTVGANAGTSFQISGIPTGTQYNTVTVCRGNFQGKDVEIGRVELKRSF